MQALCPFGLPAVPVVVPVIVAAASPSVLAVVVPVVVARAVAAVCPSSCPSLPSPWPQAGCESPWFPHFQVPSPWPLLPAEAGERGWAAVGAGAGADGDWS